MKLRKELKPMVANTRGDSGFKGRLIVLVDSDSASASEVLARVVQLEKRGTVIGDRTSGKVMRSRLYPHQIGLETVVFYGFSVTDADLVMSDGRGREGWGWALARWRWRPAKVWGRQKVRGLRGALAVREAVLVPA